MALARASGVVLHPTSFPGRGGIGELGSAGYRWIDWLHEAGQRIWQVLPLGPTGYGDSPYQSFSAFAGNPLLISLEALYKQGLIDEAEWAAGDQFASDAVDFGGVIPWKMGLLRGIYQRVMNADDPAMRTAFEQFAAEQRSWLDDYALFSALKLHFAGAAWNEWDAPIRRREPAAVAEWRQTLNEQIRIEQFLQFLFFNQWRELHHYAHARGVRIMGDIPIFVAFDSADVWANPDLFFLDAEGNPTVVAGVPPDYFSATGQRWGNPLYRWDVLEKRGFDWWIERVRATLAMVDFVRIDHFRGFEAYWEIPAAEATAVKGQWVPGPGVKVFYAIRDALGDVPIVAEDLGVITPEVEAMRDEMAFPGMKVLQFAWSDDASNFYLPHNYVRNCIAYTGTHDSDTTVGWYETASERERTYVQVYTNSDGSHVALRLHRLALQSVAVLAIAPLQDLLQLPTAARMNYPGRESGNWGWRYQHQDLSSELAGYLRHQNIIFGRWSPEENSLPST